MDYWYGFAAGGGWGLTVGLIVALAMLILFGRRPPAPPTEAQRSGGGYQHPRAVGGG